MAKLEKVIKACECCRPCNTHCKKCPYDTECYHDKLCNSAISDMVDLLKEKQDAVGFREPKKVEHKATLYKSCTCPSCGNVVDHFENWGEQKVRIFEEYCKFCGQHLDWSEELRKDGDGE